MIHRLRSSIAILIAFLSLNPLYASKEKNNKDSRSCSEMIGSVISRRNFLRVAAVGGVGAIGTGLYLWYSSSPHEETRNASSSWQNWVERFSLSSPISAHNRVSRWRLSAEQISDVIQGRDFVLTFDESVWHRGRLVNNIPFAPLARNLERVAEPNDRDTAIVEYVHGLMQNNRPERLLIVHMGARHTQDYFLAYPNDPIHYANQPFDQSVVLGNDAYR